MAIGRDVPLFMIFVPGHRIGNGIPAYTVGLVALFWDDQPRCALVHDLPQHVRDGAVCPVARYSSTSVSKHSKCNVTSRRGDVGSASSFPRTAAPKLVHFTLVAGLSAFFGIP